LYSSRSTPLRSTKCTVPGCSPEQPVPRPLASPACHNSGRSRLALGIGLRLSVLVARISASCSTVEVTGSGEFAGRNVTSTSTCVPGRRKPATPTTSSLRSDMARMPSGIFYRNPRARTRAGQLPLQNRLTSRQWIHHNPANQRLRGRERAQQWHRRRPLNQAQVSPPDRLPCSMFDAAATYWLLGAGGAGRFFDTRWLSQNVKIPETHQGDDECGSETTSITLPP